MTRAFRLTIVLVALVGASGLAQRDDADATGVISGQVLDSQSTRPIPGAIVRLLPLTQRSATIPTPVIADAQGRFVFSNLPPEEFRVFASRDGWRDGAYGLDTPAESALASGAAAIVKLGPGGRARVTVPLWKKALISGRVTDESGQPLAGATVWPTQWSIIRGRKRLGGSAELSTTDDLGRFAIALIPGEWMITAHSAEVRTVRDAAGRARRVTFARTFFPNSATAGSAAALSLQSGDERNGLEIRVRSVPVVRVSGVLRRPVEAGRMPYSVFLLAQEDGDDYAASTIDPQGRFAFDSVPAGRYVVQTAAIDVHASSEPGPLWARASVDVGDRDLDVTVDLHPPVVVSGRLRFDGSPGITADAVRGSFSLELSREDELLINIDTPPASVPVSPDGRFTFTAAAGRYGVAAGFAPADRAASGARWTLRSVMRGDIDVADTPFDLASSVSDLLVTFTDRRAVLKGRVTSRIGSIESSSLVVFPIDDTIWTGFPVSRRISIRPLPRDGSFEISDLPEGDYLVTAIRVDANAAPYDEMRNAIFLRAVAAQAKRVTLLEGQTQVQDLELLPPPVMRAAVAPLPEPLHVPEQVRSRERSSSNPVAGARISGVVLDAKSKQPVASAHVTAGANAPGTYTDTDGRFTLDDLPSGPHTVYVSKPTYVNAVYGATGTDDTGTAITVTNGQRIEGVAIELSKGAVLSGTVRDQHGMPIPHAQIHARAFRWQANGRQLVTPKGHNGLPFEPINTDERGEYRAYGLPPGSYVVHARLNGESAVQLTTQADLDVASASASAGAARIRTRALATYPLLFYPDTIDSAGAEVVKLAAGEERVLDFHFSPVTSVTIAGTVLLPPATSIQRVTLQLTSRDSLLPPYTSFRSGTADAAGAFTISGVSPGRYRLTAFASDAAGLGLIGTAEMSVDADLRGVVLGLAPFPVISGRIVTGFTATDSGPGRYVSLIPLEAGPDALNQRRSASLRSDGTFTFGGVGVGVVPGRYRFEVGGPATAGPRVAAQIVNGVDTSDGGLEVSAGAKIEVELHLTASEARVSGRVRDQRDRPASQPFVVLFAKDPSRWTPPSRRIFGGRPDQNGAYLFPDVPAGEYLITTLGGVEAGDWFDPSLLAKIASAASPIVVRRGDKLEIDIETR